MPSTKAKRRKAKREKQATDDAVFAWSKCEQGYQLRNGRRTIAVADFPARFSLYRPLECSPVLFAIFADKPHSSGGMLEFCQQYGIPCEDAPRRGAVPTGANMISSVSVEVLLQHHTKFRSVLRKYEAGNGDPSALIEHFNIEDGGLGVVHVLLHRQQNGEISAMLHPPDLVRAMWLQFASAACSGKRFGRCAHCGEPFLTGHGTGHRSTMVFCKAACKVAASRKRQRDQESVERKPVSNLPGKIESTLRVLA